MLSNIIVSFGIDDNICLNAYMEQMRNQNFPLLLLSSCISYVFGDDHTADVFH